MSYLTLWKWTKNIKVVTYVLITVGYEVVYFGQIQLAWTNDAVKADVRTRHVPDEKRPTRLKT